MQEQDLKIMLQSLLNNLFDDLKSKSSTKQWLSLQEASEYIGVSYNTLMKLRLHGLKIAEINGVKRISKNEIDNFLNENSF
ncbi:helix-turn-helix domain-containing protein [Ureibacillus aquaedulcis]|uniref:Helix-turn-helix domain-containing protein n=1 Tax=Ureibacillus aquaedulcis TaxID=3058421 RepID=A0ABT8GNV1_9BACL|nr:helix-turn-helix domain-containing protein [Ureibacillus sp. BA0131]MDN4493098.1 helix-turn-helix domain-containing protein [Ureibacillus sp. BA0131]